MLIQSHLAFLHYVCRSLASCGIAGPLRLSSHPPPEGRGCAHIAGSPANASLAKALAALQWSETMRAFLPLLLSAVCAIAGCAEEPVTSRIVYFAELTGSEISGCEAFEGGSTANRLFGFEEPNHYFNPGSGFLCVFEEGGEVRSAFMLTRLPNATHAFRTEIKGAGGRDEFHTFYALPPRRENR